MMNELKSILKRNALLALRSTQSRSKAVVPMGVIFVENLHFQPSIRYASFIPSQKSGRDCPNKVCKKKVLLTNVQPSTHLSKSLLAPMNTISLCLPPIGCIKVKKRLFSNALVMDGDSFDCRLRERELDMLRHPAGPIKRMDKLSKDALKGHKHHELKHELKLLDLESKPPDLLFSLAKEFPSAELHSLSTCPEALKVMADWALKSHLPNISTHVSKSEMFDLKDIDENSYDLVTSCFGLQKSINPQKSIQEIHRVLKPGGTLVACVWEHLGTENILNKMMARILKGSPDAYLSETNTLTKPHIFEKMIEDSGLSCLDIEHGEFPLRLSESVSSDTAFDLVSLPIKDKLASLMMSGKRPYAFEDARAAFDDATSKGLIRRDSKGYTIDGNRYKILVARRGYEDGDKVKDVTNWKLGFTNSSRSDIVKLSTLSSADPISDFNDLLDESFSGCRYNPMPYFEDAIKHTIQAEGHDVKTLKVLEIGSRPAKTSRLLADIIPDATIYSANFRGSLKLMENMKSDADRNPDIDLADFSDSQLSKVLDGSIDIVMSAFGLHYFEDPNAVIKQVHRILKSGGSFIVTTWDSIALEHIANRIMTRVIGKGHAPYEFLNFDAFAAPHDLENLINYGGLCVVKQDHHEFPFVLAKDGVMDDEAFNAAILPVRHILKNLEMTGTHPNAGVDARNAFDEMVANGELMSVDKHGCLITEPNKFNLMIARRLFEDSDGLCLE